MTRDEALYELALAVRTLCLRPYYSKEFLARLDTVAEALRPAADGSAGWWLANDLRGRDPKDPR